MDSEREKLNIFVSGRRSKKDGWIQKRFSPPKRLGGRRSKHSSSSSQSQDGGDETYTKANTSGLDGKRKNRNISRDEKNNVETNDDSHITDDSDHEMEGNKQIVAGKAVESQQLETNKKQTLGGILDSESQELRQNLLQKTITLLDSSPQNTAATVTGNATTNESNYYKNSLLTDLDPSSPQYRELLKNQGVHNLTPIVPTSYDERDFINFEEYLPINPGHVSHYPPPRPKHSEIPQRQHFTEHRRPLPSPEYSDDDDYVAPKYPTPIKSQTKPPPVKNNKTYIYCMSVVSIILIGILAVYLRDTNPDVPVIPDKTNIPSFSLIEEIKKLKSEYPSQDRDTWNYLRVGLESVRNFSRPTIFMVAHHNNEALGADLVDKIGRLAAVYIKNNMAAYPLKLYHTNLQLSNHGELITRYKETFKKYQVMVVNDIERVPGIVAQGFRYFCDEYSPMVDQSVVLFTINLDNCPSRVEADEFSQANPLQTLTLIESCLKSIWQSELDINIIQPVLIRIVGTVLKIRPESEEVLNKIDM